MENVQLHSMDWMQFSSIFLGNKKSFQEPSINWQYNLYYLKVVEQYILLYLHIAISMLKAKSYQFYLLSYPNVILFFMWKPLSFGSCYEHKTKCIQLEMFVENIKNSNKMTK